MRLYVKISTMMFSDPKILAVSVAARWLYVCGLMWSKEHLTDGEVSREAIQMFGVANAKKCADELVKACLWMETDKGFTVGTDKWATYQTTREEVEEERQRAKERTRVRVSEHRARKRALQSVTDGVTGNVTDALQERYSNAKSNACNVGAPPPENREQRTENKDKSARAPSPPEKTPNNTAAIAAVLSGAGFSPVWAHRTAGMFRTLDPDRVAEIVELVAERYPGRPADRQALTYTALTAEGTADAWHRPRPEQPQDPKQSPAFLAAMARAGGTTP